MHTVCVKAQQVAVVYLFIFQTKNGKPDSLRFEVSVSLEKE